MAKQKNSGVVAAIAAGITITAFGSILFGTVFEQEEEDPLLILSDERVPLADMEQILQDNAGYSFEINGVEIVMDAPAIPIIAKLGTPSQYLEAEDDSSHDRTYCYEGYDIATYTKDNVECIAAVFVMDESLITTEGIGIGMDKSEMEEVYGSDYIEEDDMCIYQKNGMGLEFLLHNNQITYFQYLSSNYM